MGAKVSSVQDSYISAWLVFLKCEDYGEKFDELSHSREHDLQGTGGMVSLALSSLV